MRQNLARMLVVIGAVFLALSSCATVEEEPAVLPPEIDSSAAFLERGIAFVAQAARYELLDHINEHGASFPEAREQLFGAIADQEIAEIDRLLAASEPLAARARLGTLHALTGQKLKLAAAAERVRAGLLDAGHVSSARAMNPDAADDTHAREPIASSDAIADYRSILAQVHVSTSVENPDGIIRRSPRTFAGSGFLVGESLLVTAYHVVEEIHHPDVVGYEVTVMIDGSRFGATPHSWDSILDVAVLRLDESVPLEFDVIERLAHSHSLDFGDEIYGLGHHSGLAETLTGGIVSAPTRRAPEIGNWIQIDAPVTGGASGGMLIGPDGLIHGMLVAGLVGEDLNFAVPSTDILSVVDPLLEGVKLRRPWLGVLLMPDSAGDEQPGVRVRDRFPSSPIAAADVAADDVITQVNHIPVSTVAEAQAAIGTVSPGNILHVQIQREDHVTDRWVLVASRPDYAMYNGHGEFDRISTLYPFFGFSINEYSLQAIELVSSDGPSSILLYTVDRVDERTFVHAMGVRTGHRVGFIFDEFFGMTRVVRLFHVPQGMSVDQLHSVDDYIYTIERGRYDQNIL